MAARRVSGVLFAEYVRMMRGQKQIDWSALLEPEDVRYLLGKIDLAAWYPMQTFERMGNAILDRIAGGSLDAVRAWGRYSVEELHRAQPRLLAPGDPVDTLMRFRVLRASYFDFEALEVTALSDGESAITIHYFMGPKAEEAASYQTMGFFERLLELAGARDVRSRFLQRSWAGGAGTVLSLEWTSP